MKSQNVVILVIGTMFIFVVAGVVAIAVAIPEGARAGSLISLLIATLAPTIAAIVAVAQLGGIAERQRQISGQVNDLANGKGDQKIQRNVHAALDDRRAALDERLDAAHQRNTTTPDTTEETPS